MVDKCYICHIEERLLPVLLKWEMFDGTPVEVKTFRCESCMDTLNELMSYNPQEKEEQRTLNKIAKELADGKK